MQVKKKKPQKVQGKHTHTTTLKNIPYTIVIGTHHGVALGGSWWALVDAGGAGGGGPARAGGRCAYFIERVLFQGESFIQGGGTINSLRWARRMAWGLTKGVSCKRCHCPLLRADLAKGFLLGRSCVSSRVCFAHFPFPPP